jgi:hypothetical protein
MRTSQSTAGGSAKPSGPGNGPAPSSGNLSLRSGAGQRLPVPPRERKPALAAIAVLLILGGALTSAYLVMASGQRVSAIRVKEPVAAGQQIPQSALEEVQIGDTGIAYLRWNERGKVSQAYAAVPLVPGALLTNQMMAQPDAAATQGRVVVGLALKPGQLPSKDLVRGDHVAVYAVGGPNSGVPGGTVLAPDGIVQDVRQLGEGTLESTQTRISVAVPPDQAPALAEAASASAAAVALVPAGTTVPSTAPGAKPSGAQQSSGAQQNGRQTATPGGG